MKTKRRLAATLAMALVLAALAVATARQRAKPTSPILYSPPITRIELLPAGAGAFGTLGMPWLRRPPDVTLPQGYKPARLPQGYEAARSKRGEWAVVAERVPTRSAPLGSYAIYVVDKSGTRATWVVANKYGGMGIIGWDASGKTLAIWTMQLGPKQVGEVKLAAAPDWRPRTVLKLTHVSGGGGAVLRPFIGIWSRERLFLAAGVTDHDQVWEVNARTHKARKVHDEASNMDDIPIGRVMVSPDGRFILFDRSWSHLAHMAACAPGFPVAPGQKRKQITADTFMGASGIWLLDPSAGTARQITRERSKQYHHLLVDWQDDHTLLLARRDRGRGTWDWHHAALRR